MFECEIICDYGCGQPAKHQIGKKWCCETNFNKCSYIQNKQNVELQCDCCDKVFTRPYALSSHKRNIELQKQNDIEYLKNPSLCLKCDGIISRKALVHKSKFCSKSCAATYNQTGKPKSAKTKENISKGLKLTRPKRPKINRNQRLTYTGVKYHNCKICNTFYVQPVYRHRTTCSVDCSEIAKNNRTGFNNQKKRFFPIDNPNTGTTVTLESTWEFELATILNENNIHWIRPKFIKWTDATGKLRRYFPDFYLKDFDVYLDPKNKYLVTLDQEKLQKISKMVSLVYGNVDHIVSILVKEFGATIVAP